jgi:hypothetical protein
MYDALSALDVLIFTWFHVFSPVFHLFSRFVVQLEACKAPMYDVLSALDVLVGGGYPRLPAAIADLRGELQLSEAERARAERDLDTAIRERLLSETKPPRVRCLTIRERLLAKTNPPLAIPHGTYILDDTSRRHTHGIT